MKRVFIAIPVPAEAGFLDALSELREQVEGTGVVKWVEGHNLHLTLKFLGEVDERTVDKIKTTLAGISEGFSSFTFSLKGFGYFGSKRQPTVVFAGIDNQEIFRGMAEKVDIALEELGFEREPRPFKAHLTVGRIKSVHDSIALLKAINGFEGVFFQSAIADRLVFFESILTREGPIYKPLLTLRLTNC